MQAAIRTPDQRLRVFVSSTLQELAAERAAVRQAIEALRLTPVMFELGARSHPPKDVYRSYLEQSDVFVGVYGDRYGWVGPDLEVSGLEDEYLRASELPQLLYVKAPAPSRDQRLVEFVKRLEQNADVSYKTFGDADDLGELVRNDLALLLTERFDERTRARIAGEVPVPLDVFVGREDQIAALRRALEESRLVTLTGSGGVGKTRLALEVARGLAGKCADGAHVVSLSAVASPDLVTSAIVSALDVPVAPGTTPLDAIVEHLRGRQLLLVLDNFEHVVEAAPVVGAILAAAPGVTALVTSREVLKVRGERELRLEPLATEGPNSPAARLFIERARQVDPAFAIDGESSAAIAALSRRLEGLPLALELAAARVRLLSPEAILERIERGLDVGRGGRDLPERHQTLRAAIDWSFVLLDDDERSAFAQASVFLGGWTLDAAAAVFDADAVDLVESLLEKSLIKRTEPDRFSMLATVRDFAVERLAAEGDEADTRSRHASYYLELVARAAESLRRSGQIAALAKLDRDEDNVRAALRWSLDAGDGDAVAEAGVSLMHFWWLRGRFDESARWMGEALESPRLTTLGRARALFVSGLLAFLRGDYAGAVPALMASVQAFAASGDSIGAAMAEIPLAALRAGTGDHDALVQLEAARAVVAEAGDEWALVMATNGLCWALNALEADAPIALFEEGVARAEQAGSDAELAGALGNLGRRRALRGELREAADALGETLRIVRRLRSPSGTAYYLGVIADVASAAGEHELALRLFSAAAEIGSAAQVETPQWITTSRERALERARAACGETAVEAAAAEGSAWDADVAAAAALAWASR